MTTDQMLERIREQERLVEVARESWDEMKNQAALAKKVYDKSVERLCKMVKDSDSPDLPLIEEVFEDGAA